MRIARISAVLLLCSATAARFASAQTSAVDPAAIDASIARAKQFLFSQQHDDNWERLPKADDTQWAMGLQWGGSTAVATLALLVSGESPGEPHVAKALGFLKKVKLQGTYSLAVRAQIWRLLPRSTAIVRLAELDADQLVALQHTDQAERGLFGYGVGRLDPIDMSTSQMGVLGAWAAAQTGAEVPGHFWEYAQEGWIKMQNADGSWDYIPKGAQHAKAFTPAGIATLAITQTYCGQEREAANRAMDAGLKFLDVHAAEFEETGGSGFEPNHADYQLYTLERAGAALGIRAFGDYNWFDRGARQLMAVQAPDGSYYPPDFGATAPAETAMGLIFMARGRAPVIMNKLRYGQAAKGSIFGGPWNKYPRDLLCLSQLASAEMESQVTWQVVSLDQPMQSLHESQVLYVSGEKPLAFSPQEQDKLRLFVEEGGLILCDGAGGEGMAKSVADLGRNLFHDYEFVPVPENDPIYTRQQYPRKHWGSKPEMSGISNGVRWLMLMVQHPDVSKSWQSDYRLSEPCQLGMDVYLYATDKEKLNRGRTWQIAPDAKVTPTRTVRLARLNCGANWNPEPGGWRRLPARLLNVDKIKLDVQVVELGKGQLAGPSEPDGFAVAHMTGTTTMKLTEPQINELKHFTDAGGLLIVDAAGGSSTFADAIGSQLSNALGGDLIAGPILPKSDPVFSASTAPLRDVAFRPYLHDLLGHPNGPQIRAIIRNGKPAVLFSRLDLSGGLVGEPTDGILGYAPDTATEMMANFICAAGR